MQLTDLLNTEKDLPVEGVTSDSRQVKEGYLFAALPGSKAQGDKFIEDAIAHGAKIILAKSGAVLPTSFPNDVVLIEDENPRLAFAKIASLFYKRQPKKL